MSLPPLMKLFLYGEHTKDQLEYYFDLQTLHRITDVSGLVTTKTWFIHKWNI